MANNREKILASAQRFLEKGNIARAIKEYARVVEIQPEDIRTRLRIGDLQARIGQRGEAIETYEGVAREYFARGFFPKAVAVYKQILRLDTSRTDIQIQLANLYLQMNLLSDSLAQFREVAEQFRQQGQTEELAQVLHQIIDIDPYDVTAQVSLGEHYSSRGMVAEATEHFAVATDQLREINHSDEYIKVAERYFFHRPDDVERLKDLVLVYLRREDYKRALAKLQLIFKNTEKDPQALRYLADCFMGLKKRDRAVRVLKELAELYVEQGQEELAVEVYRRVFSLDPEDVDARIHLGLSVPPGAAAQAGTARATPSTLSRVTLDGMPRATPSGLGVAMPPGMDEVTQSGRGLSPSAGTTRATPSGMAIAIPPTMDEVTQAGRGPSAGMYRATPSGMAIAVPPGIDEVARAGRGPTPAAGTHRASPSGMAAAASRGPGASAQYPAASRSTPSTGYPAGTEQAWARVPSSAGLFTYPGNIVSLDRSLHTEQLNAIYRFLAESDQCLQAGDYDRGLKLLAQALGIDPHNISAMERLVQMYLYQGMVLDAIDLLCNLARQCFRADPRRSAGYLDECQRLDPRHQLALAVRTELGLDRTAMAAFGPEPPAPANGRGDVTEQVHRDSVGYGPSAQDIGYSQGGQVYPQGGQVYPQDGQVYPQDGQVYPQDGQVYPQGGRRTALAVGPSSVPGASRTQPGTLGALGDGYEEITKVAPTPDGRPGVSTETPWGQSFSAQWALAPGSHALEPAAISPSPTPHVPGYADQLTTGVYSSTGEPVVAEGPVQHGGEELDDLFLDADADLESDGALPIVTAEPEVSPIVMAGSRPAGDSGREEAGHTDTNPLFGRRRMQPDAAEDVILPPAASQPVGVVLDIPHPLEDLASAIESTPPPVHTEPVSSALPAVAGDASLQAVTPMPVPSGEVEAKTPPPPPKQIELPPLPDDLPGELKDELMELEILMTSGQRNDAQELIFDLSMNYPEHTPLIMELMALLEGR